MIISGYPSLAPLGQLPAINDGLNRAKMEKRLSIRERHGKAACIERRLALSMKYEADISLDSRYGSRSNPSSTGFVLPLAGYLLDRGQVPTS
jgi:hypothetical protein